MKPLPERIHWAGMDYSVEIVEKLDGRQSWGRTMFDELKIRIEAEMCSERQWETLVHELMHLAYRQTANTQLGEKEEENIIKPWATNIFAVLRDNGLLAVDK